MLAKMQKELDEAEGAGIATDLSKDRSASKKRNDKKTVTLAIEQEHSEDVSFPEIKEKPKRTIIPLKEGGGKTLLMNSQQKHLANFSMEESSSNAKALYMKPPKPVVNVSLV